MTFLYLGMGKSVLVAGVEQRVSLQTMVSSFDVMQAELFTKATS